MPASVRTVFVKPNAFQPSSTERPSFPLFVSASDSVVVQQSRWPGAPNDILVEIFAYLDRDYDEIDESGNISPSESECDILNVAHVCHRWRDVVGKNAQLWGHVVVNSERLADLSPAHAMSRVKAKLKEGPTSEVEMSSPWGDSTSPEMAWAWLGVATPHWKDRRPDEWGTRRVRAQFTSGLSMGLVWTVFRDSLAQLRSLKMCAAPAGLGAVHVTPVCPPPSQLVALQVLEINGIAAPSLTSLEPLLALTPVLRTLSVHGTTDLTLSIGDPRQIILKDLVHLSLSSRTADMTPARLRLSMPRLEVLDLCGTLKDTFGAVSRLLLPTTTISNASCLVSLTLNATAPAPTNGSPPERRTRTKRSPTRKRGRRRKI